MAEPGVTAAVEQEIRLPLHRIRPNVVMAPLAVGDHVDHVVTSTAVKRCNIDPARMRWFEDIPYALYSQLRGWEARRAKTLVAETVKLGEPEWRAKVDALGRYASQLGILWHDPTPWRQQLRAYADGLGGGRSGERLWRSAASC